MKVKKGSVSPSGLTVVLINKSDQEGMYGEDFRLERRIHDEWIQVKVTIEGNYGFNDIGFNLNSKSQALWTADWTWLYGLLDPGEYRIIKTLLDFRETGDFGEQELSAEFTFK